ncbi:MAG: Nodulation protein noeA, partial [Chthonomonadaceae bacterium]|nr:Nodulation protein noeA [Chthonomonadaceae bacterium]
MSLSVDPGSFRDPSGFIFYREETLVRHVQSSYQEQYDLLTGSGLYKALVDAG